MDSDDTIDADNGRKLRALAEADPDIMGLVMQVHCPGHGDNGAVEVTVVDHVKLFRNLPELRFERRIHERRRALSSTAAWPMTSTCACSRRWPPARCS
jgi:hypothetical protein